MFVSKSSDLCCDPEKGVVLQTIMLRGEKTWCLPYFREKHDSCWRTIRYKSLYANKCKGLDEKFSSTDKKIENIIVQENEFVLKHLKFLG